MAEALDQAADGDGSALLTFSRQLALDRSRGDRAGDGAAVRGQAAPHGRLRGLARGDGSLRGENFALGPTNGWWLWGPCATWPVKSAHRYTGPWNATTPNPVLVVGTRAKRGPPTPGARAVAGLLGNAVLLTHDGYGHTTSADPSACVVAAMGAYLTDLTTPPPGTVCPSDRGPSIRTSASRCPSGCPPIPAAVPSGGRCWARSRTGARLADVDGELALRVGGPEGRHGVAGPVERVAVLDRDPEGAGVQERREADEILRVVGVAMTLVRPGPSPAAESGEAAVPSPVRAAACALKPSGV